MRITQEADYALRAVYMLAICGSKTGARDISEKSAVPVRFCIKILQKLTAAGITKSYKGVNGGYSLNREPKDITLKDIIEAVDGPIEINLCLDGEYRCSSAGDVKMCCTFHRIFDRLNVLISDKLSAINMAMLADSNISLDDILETFN